MEGLSNAYLAEGLQRLADNVKQIEFYRSESTSACEKANAPPDYDALKKIPEFMAWKSFREAVIDELNAAAKAMGDKSEMRSCRRLAAVLEASRYAALAESALDAIVELNVAMDSLEESPASAVNKPASRRTISVTDFASRLDVSADTVRRRARDGELPQPHIPPGKSRGQVFFFDEIAPYLPRSRRGK